MANPLGALFAFFFKYRPAVFQQGDFAFGCTTAPDARSCFRFVGVAIAIPAVLSYRRVRARSTPQGPGSCFARALRISCACRPADLPLLRPMLVLNAAVPQRNFVGVLIDDSRSMQIADRAGRTRADWIRDSVTVRNSALLAAAARAFR